jgi:hypothetical protein
VRNALAVWSLLLGLLAAAAVPATVVYVDRTPGINLLWAAVSVPVAYALGVAAIVASRAARRRAQLTLRRRSGAATARLGRLLGLLGLLLAGTGTIALAVYAVLTYRGRA